MSRSRSKEDTPGVVSRRRFTTGLAAAGVGAAGLGTLGCANGEATGAAESGRATSSDSGSRFEELLDSPLREVDVATMSADLDSGAVTAVRLLELYTDVIEATNRTGPDLRAVIELDPTAEETAAALDAERAEGRVRGPLHGVPILLKDNIDTNDGTTTTAGSLALEGSRPERDSEVARRLREAGAVLFGKANLSEWANFRSNNSSSGWSGRGGQCRNPYALDRNPCGSSSGSGAAVSASQCAVAIGTETNGSIVCPSSANGLVGIKPTVGLVSRKGIIPISAVQDTAGPMARTVEDAAIVLSVIAGTDAWDPATAEANNHRTDYTQFLDAAGLGGKKIGVWRGTRGFSDAVLALLEEATAVLRDAGAEVVDIDDLGSAGQAGRHSYEAMLYEFKDGLNEYLKGLGESAPVKTLADVIAFNEREAARSMPFFGQEILLAAEEKGPLSEDAYKTARAEATRLARDEGLDAVRRDHGVDVVIAPTGGPAWVTDLVNGDHFGGGSSSAAAISGYPNITLPMGHVHGLPVGLSWFATSPWQEGLLIQCAYAFEQATGHRTAPRLLAEVPRA